MKSFSALITTITPLIEMAAGSPAPNWGQQSAFKCVYKYEELGYQASIQTPHNKDSNEDLVNYGSGHNRNEII
jgi:hypothetical protein